MSNPTVWIIHSDQPHRPTAESHGHGSCSPPVVHPPPHLSGGDEEGHVGGAHHGVADPCKDGDNTEEHDVEGDAVDSNDDGEEDVVVVGETFVLLLH